MNLRKKEPWMAPGSAVQISSGMGVIRHVLECVPGDTLGLPQVPHVMQLYVQPVGVKIAHPMSPLQVECASHKRML